MDGMGQKGIRWDGINREVLSLTAESLEPFQMWPALRRVVKPAAQAAPATPHCQMHDRHPMHLGKPMGQGTGKGRWQCNGYPYCCPQDGKAVSSDGAMSEG